MDNLDDIAAMKQLDSASVLGSIEQLGGQCRQAWDEVSALTFPDSYKNVTAIVFSGMGGSALGAYVVKSLFGDSLKIPFEIVNDYHLPLYVGKQTLVILGSYSGATEETLSCAQEALTRGAQVTGLTVGGKLGQLLQTNAVPVYIFEPKSNPSNQPRLGTGYSVFGQIALFNALGLLAVDSAEIAKVIDSLETGMGSYGVRVATSQNQAKQLAQKWVNKIPIIVSAQFLTQVGRVIRNQLHESAKSFAAYHEIPELNHHLMEGLTNPKGNREMLRFLFLDSGLYSEKIKQRIRITKEVIKKQGISVDEFTPSSQGKITQVFECIQFGAFTNYYLAMLYDLDPSQIPWVDYFKTQLGK